MGNNIQLYIVLLMVTISIVSTIIKKGRDVAEQRRAKLEIERRQLEGLRTGRTEAQVAAQESEDNPAAALARRREAQLEELRRIQRERARAQAAGNAGTTRPQTQHQPLPKPQMQQRQQPTAHPETKAKPRAQARPQPHTPSRAQPRPKDSRTRQPAAQNTAEMFAAMERQRLQDTGESTTQRTVRDVTPAPAAAAKILPPSSGNPWRDAFLMQELLGPPLSMREARTPGLDSL